MRLLCFFYRLIKEFIERVLKFNLNSPEKKNETLFITFLERKQIIKNIPLLFISTLFSYMASMHDSSRMKVIVRTVDQQ